MRWWKLYILSWSKISTISLQSYLTLQPKWRLRVQSANTDFAAGTSAERMFTFFIRLRKIPRKLLFDNSFITNHDIGIESPPYSVFLTHGTQWILHNPNKLCRMNAMLKSCACLRSKHSSEGPELSNLTSPLWLTVLIQLTCANREDEQSPKAPSLPSPGPVVLCEQQGFVFKARGCSTGAGSVQAHMVLCLLFLRSLQHVHFCQLPAAGNIDFSRFGSEMEIILRLIIQIFVSI